MIFESQFRSKFYVKTKFSFFQDQKYLLQLSKTVFIANFMFFVFFSLEYCPDQVLRFTVWEDYVKFISMEYDQWLQASINIEGIRINRNKYAQALGYKHYAEMSMETKMAENLDNVYNALNTVVEVGTLTIEYFCNKFFSHNHCINKNNILLFYSSKTLSKS